MHQKLNVNKPNYKARVLKGNGQFENEPSVAYSVQIVSGFVNFYN